MARHGAMKFLVGTGRVLEMAMPPTPENSAAVELSQRELQYRDPDFELIIAVRAKRPSIDSRASG